MNRKKDHNARIANMTFATVYPLYLAKIEKKGRSKEELLQVIQWLTGYDETQIKKQIETHPKNATFDNTAGKAIS